MTTISDSLSSYFAQKYSVNSTTANGLPSDPNEFLRSMQMNFNDMLVKAFLDNDDDEDDNKKNNSLSSFFNSTYQTLSGLNNGSTATGLDSSSILNSIAASLNGNTSSSSSDLTQSQDLGNPLSAAQYQYNISSLLQDMI